MVRCDVVGVAQVDAVWPKIARGLEKACRATGGDIDSNYLWSECRSGAAFLVVVTRNNEILAASVWRFENWSSGRKLRCLAIYGRDMKSWLAQHEKIIADLARFGGASSIVAEGRRGWGRIFKRAKVLRELFEVKMT